MVVMGWPPYILLYILFCTLCRLLISLFSGLLSGLFLISFGSGFLFDVEGGIFKNLSYWGLSNFSWRAVYDVCCGPVARNGLFSYSLPCGVFYEGRLS